MKFNKQKSKESESYAEDLRIRKAERKPEVIIQEEVKHRKNESMSEIPLNNIYNDDNSNRNNKQNKIDNSAIYMFSALSSRNADNSNKAMPKMIDLLSPMNDRRSSTSSPSMIERGIKKIMEGLQGKLIKSEKENKRMRIQMNELMMQNRTLEQQVESFNEEKQNFTQVMFNKNELLHKMMA